MMNMKALFLLALAGSAQAFAPAPITHSVNTISSQSCNKFTTINRIATSPIAPTTSTTALSERQWNFNEGRGPFGMKRNAEVWNGRVAQMAFVIVLLQELITGKGVIKSIQDGDITGYAGLGFFVVTVLGLTAFLASKGDGRSAVMGTEGRGSLDKMPSTEAEVKAYFGVDEIDFEAKTEFFDKLKKSSN
mmetsp:Transcript_25466/g.52636  ORF Transcript_25466/g.52636 Transcript_25466/m.52636 type:complete len:190 (+) Transcript_25466:33-602(+)